MDNTKIMSLDYGETRIGIAISDELKIIAAQSRVIINSKMAISNIIKLAEENKVSTIVIGFPKTLKNTTSQITEKVTEFTGEITKLTKCKIVLWDERLTSKMAVNAMHEIGLKKKSRQEKGRVDELAARFILQSYLDSRN